MAKELEHGYVGIMQVNADNDDGDPVPEPPADPPRDNDDDTPSEQDDDLVAIKIEVKKPEDFKFEEEMLQLQFPENVRIFGSNQQLISRDSLENGVNLGSGADGGLGDAVANEEVVLYAEGMGVLDEEGPFDGGEFSLEILEGALRTEKAGGYLLPVDIVPDWNRDGMINGEDRSKATEEKPFMFSINDDDDENPEPEWADIPQSGTDGNDMVVNGKCDLVDFFPVQLRLEQLLEVLPSNGYIYRISHPTGAFHFIEIPTIQPDSQRSNGAGSSLADESKAAEAMNNQMKDTAGEGSELSAEYLDAVKNGMAVLLFESKSATNQSFELIVSKKGGGEIVRISRALPVEIDDVEKMYWRSNMEVPPKSLK